MKKLNKQRCKKGFTLIEMLVVVLIIGILAGIALPQYQMAVTKAKVASILPLMRRWKDALQEYKLQHGDYDIPYAEAGEYLGVTWPSDWRQYRQNTACGNYDECENDYWRDCLVNEESFGEIYCEHGFNGDGGSFTIRMHQSDDPNENYRGKIICIAELGEGHKVCKALGGKFIHGDGESWTAYSLN